MCRTRSRCLLLLLCAVGLFLLIRAAKMYGNQNTPATKSKRVCRLDLHPICQDIFSTAKEVKNVSVQCTEEFYSCVTKYCNGSFAKYSYDPATCRHQVTDCYNSLCKSSDLCSNPSGVEDTSLSVGLLILFFLVLPVAILAAVAVMKCDAIRRKFCRKSRGQHRDNNGQEAKQGNGASHDTGNNQPAPSSHNIFTILHFPGTRQPVQTQLPAASSGPQRPPVPPRPLV